MFFRHNVAISCDTNEARTQNRDQGRMRSVGLSFSPPTLRTVLAKSFPITHESCSSALHISIFYQSGRFRDYPAVDVLALAKISLDHWHRPSQTRLSQSETVWGKDSATPHCCSPVGRSSIENPSSGIAARRDVNFFLFRFERSCS